MENLTHEAYWKMLLAKNDKGQTLYGLLEATAVKVDTDYRICARAPWVFGDRADIVSYGVAKIFEDHIIENFDAERAGGAKNFPGYIANQMSCAVRHQLQDSLRQRSIDLRGYETEEMIEKGESYDRYTEASHTDLEAKTKSLEDDAREVNFHGSQPKDWCGRCEWDVTKPVSPEQTDTFLQNLLWELTPEEATCAQIIVAESAKEAAARMKLTKGEVSSLMKQARKRLVKLGVSADLAKKGYIV